ncbi:M14 family zinc carboxypeptidase [Haloechinothrix halophila]|uniref:M14 family zinc carboxypeptidase n=1 Tax=Haloechinothrix halophila TaxID=1069073 RepID=UPI00054E5F8E|nr:M14 family zinc carboxypeptidase [Haloechinothrix halophila]
MGGISRPVRAALTAVAAAAIAVTMIDTGQAPAHATTSDFPVQLVTVDTPTRADKELLQTLGLDLTEHAGHDFIEVVLHSAEEEDALREAGLTWDVRISDLAMRTAEVNQINEEYAASTEESPLPSGRTTYRTLADYNTDMTKLAEMRPDIVKEFELPHTSLEGKTVRGIEISRDVHEAEDGRPVFAIMGLHHAREWPSGELTMEFAYDLVTNYGSDQRITNLLDKARVLVVPVTNPDGFEKSINDGLLLDLRELDDGGLVSILGTPGNAYKRKNCRMLDGQEPLAGECAAATSNGGFGVGIDTNRNYGGLWGGPGAGTEFFGPTYRGPAPFSEPETQNIREMVSSKQVTTLITNHTFSNLVLRPNGVKPDTIGPDGNPIGQPHDEEAMKALGAKMAAQNGYRNIHGWELYDTTGTTEDWSYNATGGFGYTFEIGEHEFHPPYPEVVDEYVGAGEHEGKGNREAFLIALENAIDPQAHSVIAGKAPAGATLRLTKSFATPTWESSISDTIETTMRVGEKGKFEWHVNPSTRPIVMDRQYEVLAEEPLRSESFEGTTPAPTEHVDHEFTVTESDVDLLEVKLDWATPDDMDLEVYYREADGSLTQVASSGQFVGEKERALVQQPQQGTYVFRVINYASTAPSYTVTGSLYATESETVPRQLIENYTLTCEKDGQVLEQIPVVVDRGQQVKAKLRDCLSRW